MLIYDGGCGFCRRSLRWAYAAGGRFDATPASDVDALALGLSAQDLAEAAWWVEPDGSLLRGHEAVARVLRTSRWWPVRLLGRVVSSRPVSPISRRSYAWVAANRSRFPAWLG